MARGRLYEIATDKEKLFIVNENDIINYMDMFQIESVHDSECCDTDRNVFLDWISNYYGAVITEDGGIKVTQDAKLKYFNKRYLRFKELAKKIVRRRFFQ